MGAGPFVKGDSAVGREEDNDDDSFDSLSTLLTGKACFLLLPLLSFASSFLCLLPLRCRHCCCSAPTIGGGGVENELVADDGIVSFLPFTAGDDDGDDDSVVVAVDGENDDATAGVAVVAAVVVSVPVFLPLLLAF